MSSLKLLSALKATELKILSLACGLPVSGPKAQLQEHLSTAISSCRSLAGQRILSVDMGLRNLAFSLVTPQSRGKDTKYTKLSTGQAFRDPTPVDVTVWRHRNLAADILDRSGLLELQSKAFSPQIMAQVAFDLVHNQLLPMEPTHVLIEQQRFRTGGGSRVQEWTLRVNTLESMLHAILTTLKELGHWNGEVHAVAPHRVGSFWIDESLVDDTQEVKMLKKQAKLKQAKIQLVGDWLEQGKIVPLLDASTTAQAYLELWKGGRRKRTALKGEIGESFAKLDDLADSILQGMAWIRWEHNKHLIAQEGPAALLEAVA